MLTRSRATVRWTGTLPGINPQSYTATPDGRSVLIADGWGVAYPSLSLRRFDLRDGALLAERRLGDAARCMAFGEGGEDMIAAFDKRLRLMDLESLEEVERWDERVPRYANGIVWRDRKVLLRNGANPSANVFDLDSGRTRRFTLGPIDGLLLHELADGRVVAGGSEGDEGAIWMFESLDEPPLRWATTPALRSVAADERGAIWAAPGGRRVFRFDDATAKLSTVKVPSPAPFLACGGGELWLAGEQRTARQQAVIERLRLRDMEWLEPLRAPPGHWLGALLPQAGVAFSYGSLNADACEIACLAGG